MKYLLLSLICMISAGLWAQVSPLPITSYDYATPENNVSAIAIGMGAMNITNSTDPFASFSNPALLANNEHTHLFASFRLANEEEVSFWEAASISNALRDKQFKYFTAVAKQVAFSYQPVASVHISELDAAAGKSLYYDYKLDKVQLSMGITDKNWPHLALGLNLKYLSGRLVFLEERIQGNEFQRINFIDDKVKGFSSDLGFIYKHPDFTYAITAYDLMSGLYWENYPTKSIQRRIATGMQYGSGRSKTTLGVQSKISKNPDTTYHLGYSNGLSWDSTDFTNDSTVDQGMDFRVGIYSRDFYGADNINFTFGGGYYYQLFRFDFSLTAQGLKMADSEFLFALGIGF
jgi:hypothetical protein